MQSKTNSGTHAYMDRRWRKKDSSISSKVPVMVGTMDFVPMKLTSRKYFFLIDIVT